MSPRTSQPRLTIRSYHSSPSNQQAAPSSSTSNSFANTYDTSLSKEISSSKHSGGNSHLFPRSHPKEANNSDLLLRIKTATEERQQQPRYAQSWTPNSHDNVRHYQTDLRSNRRESSVEQARLQAFASTSNSKPHPLIDSPARRRGTAAMSEPGTPSSQERIHAYLKQRHAHALSKNQQQQPYSKATAVKEFSKQNEEEEKKEEDLQQQQPHKESMNTSRLRTLLQKRRQQANANKRETSHSMTSSNQQQTPKLAQHLEDFQEIMNTTDDDTFTTDPEVFGKDQQSAPIVLEFLKPTREQLVQQHVPKSQTTTPSKVIQAAHLAHRHANPNEFPKHDNSYSVEKHDDSDNFIVQPPALARRYDALPRNKRLSGARIDGDSLQHASPKQSCMDKSTSVTDSMSSPSLQSSRVQAIKHKLWDEQSEKLKPQTEAWQRSKANRREVDSSMRTMKQQQALDDRFRTSRFAQTYHAQTDQAKAGITIMKALKPPAAVESVRRDTNRLDSKLARHARSLSPRTSRSTASLRSGVTIMTSSTTKNRFSSRFIDAAVRTTPDRSVASHQRSRATIMRITSPPVPKSHVSVPPASSPKSGSFVDLVAELKTVSRDDPRAALAQIDAILARQGTVLSHTHNQNASIPRQQSSSRIVPQTPVDPSKEEDDLQDSDDDDNDDDDETSVSSLTNPTYAKQDALLVQAPCSAGKPRPSGLQTYNNFRSLKTRSQFREALVVDNGPTKINKRKQRRSGTPPPGSIETKCTTLLQAENVVIKMPNKEQAEQAVTMHDHERDRSLTKDERIELSLPAASHSQVPVVVASDAEDIADKISRWDQLTASLSRVFSFDAPDATAREGDINGNMAMKRAHPWDSSMLRNRIDLLETSMDAAAGLEAKFVSLEMPTSIRTSASQCGSDGDYKRRDGDVVSIGGSFNATSGRVPFDDAAASSLDAAEIVDDLSNELTKISRNYDAMNNSKSTKNRSAWVAVPSSPFFPTQSSEIRGHLQANMPLTDSYKTYRCYDRVGMEENPFEGDDTQGNRGHFPCTLKSGSPIPFNETSANRAPDGKARASFTSLALSTATAQSANSCQHMAQRINEGEKSSIEVALAPPKTNIIRRKKDLAPPQTNEVANDKGRASINSYLMRRESSTIEESTLSAGYCSAASVISRLSEKPRKSPLIEHYMSRAKDSFERDISRGRRRSKSPARQRARSLDDRLIRNPSIARKFRRLLRVYDDEKEHLYDELQKL
ncbi:hypothetical protein MPSEU_000931500 [Mayamaea pseudoterrestris]|nr:hypothetical protein MPSEU_000931500 [Mayamaea pseudoterrestris]